MNRLITTSIDKTLQKENLIFLGEWCKQTSLEKKIDNLQESIDKLDEKITNHIYFIEKVYERLRNPISNIKNIFGK